jgi:hypothetical protein
MALEKEVLLSESKSLQSRVEAFNVFNHSQFYGPAAVNGNISRTNFGAGRERGLSPTYAASREVPVLICAVPSVALEHGPGASEFKIRRSRSASGSG